MVGIPKAEELFFLNQSQKYCIFMTFSFMSNSENLIQTFQNKFFFGLRLKHNNFQFKRSCWWTFFFFLTTWERKEIQASNRVLVVSLIREQGLWRHNYWKWCTHIIHVIRLGNFLLSFLRKIEMCVPNWKIPTDVSKHTIHLWFLCREQSDMSG